MATIRDEVFFEARHELRTWLSENSARPDGVWAIFYKQSSGLGDLSWEVIVEECLCFGWIDSLPGKVDDTRTKVYISPRKVNSGWSRRNQLLVVELEKRGLMASQGADVIVRAKKNGSWTRFDLSEDLVIPSELSQAFVLDTQFGETWQSLTPSRQRQFLQQIYDAKTDSTRARRIEGVRAALERRLDFEH